MKNTIFYIVIIFFVIGISCRKIEDSNNKTINKNVDIIEKDKQETDYIPPSDKLSINNGKIYFKEMNGTRNVIELSDKDRYYISKHIFVMKGKSGGAGEGYLFCDEIGIYDEYGNLENKFEKCGSMFDITLSPDEKNILFVSDSSDGPKPGTFAIYNLEGKAILKLNITEESINDYYSTFTEDSKYFFIHGRNFFPMKREEHKFYLYDLKGKKIWELPIISKKSIEFKVKHRARPIFTRYNYRTLRIGEKILEFTNGITPQEIKKFIVNNIQD